MYDDGQPATAIHLLGEHCSDNTPIFDHLASRDGMLRNAVEKLLGSGLPCSRRKPKVRDLRESHRQHWHRVNMWKSPGGPTELGCMSCDKGVHAIHPDESDWRKKISM